MRQMQRQVLVMQYLHDHGLHEDDVEIIFEPSGGLSHKFKNLSQDSIPRQKSPSLSSQTIAEVTAVDSQITDSVTSTVFLEVDATTHDEVDATITKNEVDASKKKRPPPPKKKTA